MSLPNTGHSPCSNTSLNSSTCSERKTGNFSISAILSDDTGGSKKSRVPSFSENKDSPNVFSPMASTPNTFQCVSDGKILLSEASSIMATDSREREEGQPFTTSTPSRYPHNYAHPHPSILRTPNDTPTSQRSSLPTQSPTSSPFNISLLQAISSIATSSPETGGKDKGGREKEGDIFSCNDSLGILSTVALYHSELSEGSDGERRGKDDEGRGDGAKDVTVDGGLARMRLDSSTDATNSITSRNDRGSPPSSPIINRVRQKGLTPSILKRDRKRRRHTSLSQPPPVTTSTSTSPHRHPRSLNDQSTHLNTGFLSPPSSQRSPTLHKKLGFSPSIFLSCPQENPSQAISPCGERDGSRGGVRGGGMKGGRERSSSTDEEVGNRHLKIDEAESFEEAKQTGRGTTHDATFESKDPPLSVSIVTSLENLDAPSIATFSTSTPIKRNKENSKGFQLLPTILSPASVEAKRICLRESSHEASCSTSSDSEMVQVQKRPSRTQSRSIHHRNKARAQLSPLLENACSPISKMDPRPQSSLLTASYSVPQPTSGFSPFLPHGGPTPGISSQDLIQRRYPVQMAPVSNAVGPHVSQISFSLPPPHIPPVTYSALACRPPPPPPPAFPPATTNLCMGVVPVRPNPLIPISLSPPQSSTFYPSTHTLSPFPLAGPSMYPFQPNPFYFYHTSPTTFGCALPPANVGGQKWGGSPLTAQLERTGQIQSVPPWFIFEQNRPEGKRLRLTEAINRSLSETPSQNPKLPAEWTMYACGQTDDQRRLTQQARSFLQSGRRQLTFDELN